MLLSLGSFFVSATNLSPDRITLDVGKKVRKFNIINFSSPQKSFFALLNFLSLCWELQLMERVTF